MLTTVSKIFSGLFSPLLTGTYGIALTMLLSFLCYTNPQTKLIVIAVTFAATCIVPIIVIYGLMKAGRIKDPGLNNRSDRLVPYIIATVGYAFVGFYYQALNAPLWLSMFVWGGALALLIVTVVNTRWKISGHATGMGGLTAMMFYLLCSGNCPADIQPEFIATVLVAGIVCSSRLVLNRHTPAQVAAGFFNGLVCILVPTWFI